MRNTVPSNGLKDSLEPLRFLRILVRKIRGMQLLLRLLNVLHVVPPIANYLAEIVNIPLRLMQTPHLEGVSYRFGNRCRSVILLLCYT